MLYTSLALSYAGELSKSWKVAPDAVVRWTHPVTGEIHFGRLVAEPEVFDNVRSRAIHWQMMPVGPGSPEWPDSPVEPIHMKTSVNFHIEYVRLG